MSEANVSTIDGCVITNLTDVTCNRYLSWLLGRQGTIPIQGSEWLRWALAHCDSGVTWGYYEEEGRIWRLGNQVAPEVSPPIQRETLQELRIFGEPGEVLIWRAGTERRGRVLRGSDDLAAQNDESNPLRPSDECRMLRGDRVERNCSHRFTWIADRAGAEQVIPETITDDQLRERRVGLRVRHYYEQDPNTGAVRIAVTRLVALSVEGNQ